MRTFSLNKRSDYFKPGAFDTLNSDGGNSTPEVESTVYTDEELLSDPVVSDTGKVSGSLDLSGFLGVYKELDYSDDLIINKYPQDFSAVRNYLYLPDLKCDKQLLYNLDLLDKQKAIFLLTAILRACEVTGRSIIENTSPDIIDISEGMTKYFDAARNFDNAPDRDDFWTRNTYVLICRLGAGTIEEPLYPGVMPRCVYNCDKVKKLLYALIEMWIYDDNVMIHNYLFTNDKGFQYVDYENEDSDRLSIESEHTVFFSKKFICDILDRYSRDVLLIGHNATLVMGLLGGHVD